MSIDGRRILPFRGIGNAQPQAFFVLLLPRPLLRFQSQQQGQLVLLGHLALFECGGARSGPAFLLPPFEAGQHVLQSNFRARGALRAPLLVQLD